jgi:predicted DNA-binding transcriptional regulator YafY
MAKSIIEILDEGVDRIHFASEERKREAEAKASGKDYKKSKKNRIPVGKKKVLFSRYVRMAIRQAAIDKVQIVLDYTKITTGENKRYIVEPYEISTRNLKPGRRKVLWAYDVKDKHIKSFVLTKIKKVAITRKSFSPIWTIKIA